jgi:hypothetical protein
VRCLENPVFDFGNSTFYRNVTTIRKSEYRNPKQCQNPNVLNSKQKRSFTVGFCFGHCFVFRASYFEFLTEKMGFSVKC